MFVVASVFVFQEILFATLWVAARERTDFDAKCMQVEYDDCLANGRITIRVY